LAQPPYIPDFILYSFNLFGVLKRGQRFHSNEEVEMAVGERLRKQEQNLFREKDLA
jgi:hypothetical protein